MDGQQSESSKTQQLHRRSGQAGSRRPCTNVLDAQTLAGLRFGGINWCCCLASCASAARAESLLQQRKSRFAPAVFAVTRAATFMAAITALVSSRWASKGGVYSPSNIIFTAVCVVIIVLNRMAVGYRSPLLEYLLWKVKQRLHVWFQTERQHAGYLFKQRD